MSFDFTVPAAYDEERKRRFHAEARRRLRRLAAKLALPPGSYDLRSNCGGIAVSGEVTLHHEEVYIQVSQSTLGSGHGILFRTCAGRQDYCGGRNHFAALACLDGLPELAERLRTLLKLPAPPATCSVPGCAGAAARSFTDAGTPADSFRLCAGHCEPVSPRG